MREVVRFGRFVVGESTSPMPSRWQGSYVHYSVVALVNATTPCPPGATTRYRSVEEVLWASDPVPRNGATPRSGRVQAIARAISVARAAAEAEAAKAA